MFEPQNVVANLKYEGQLPDQDSRPLMSSDPVSGANAKEPLLYSLRDIIFLCFLGAPLAGSILLAINWKRLNKPHLYWRTIGYGLAVSIIGVVAALLFVMNTGIYVSSPAAGLRGVSFVVFLVAGVALSKWQSDDYRAWLAARGGKRPGCFRIGCWPVVALVPIMIIFNLTVIPVTVSALTAVLPSKTWQEGTVSLTYPSKYVRANDAEKSLIDCGQFECLATFGSITEPISGLFVARVSRLQLMFLSAEDVEKAFWEEIQKTTKSAHSTDLVRLKVDGQDALKRFAQDRTAKQSINYLLVKETAGSILMVFSVTENRLDIDSSYKEAEKEADAIFSTLKIAAK